MKNVLLLIIFISYSVNSSKLKTSIVNPRTNSSSIGLKCTSFDKAGVQRCVAGIESSILDIVASDTQNESQWCWAASIQGIFQYYGYYLTQEDIVLQTWGKLINMPSQANEMLSVLNRSYIDRNGNVFSVTATAYNVSHANAASDLSTDNPLIIGTMGHAMVLTAVEYLRDLNGNGEIVNATVRDPWPENSRRRNLTPQEWYSTNLLIRIRIN
ncbi:MAG: papain-like cysteine protease family protein [Nonlabens sp.]|uniref:papain-like cysteine protease family protein n=1 Tax=Nonlabens sp. TaxID=1888209 RepID=UPI003EF5905F